MEPNNKSLLKIYASTTDKVDNKLFYEFVVHSAKDAGISGVTVFRGIMGYGLSSEISSSKFWELTEKLPVMIELIDSTEKLESYYASIEDILLNMPKGCLVTIEPIAIKLQKLGKTGKHK
jgi:PII-like signaling protein